MVVNQTGPMVLASKAARKYQTSLTRPRPRWVWSIVLALTFSCVVWADEIKLGGFWIGDVSIQGIEDGQVLYFNRVGTEFTRPIERVEGLKLSAYPQLSQAYDAMDEGDDRTAQQALEQVRGKAIAPWLRHWVSRVLIEVYDRLNMPHEAVDIFLGLAGEEVPELYLSHPPTQSLAQADSDVQHMLGQRISAAMESLAGQPQSVMLRQLLESIAPDNADQNNRQQATGQLRSEGNPAATDDPGASHEQTMVLDTPLANMSLTLAKSLDIGDTVTALLVQGEFEHALERIDQILKKNSRHLPMRLYQRGIAQLYLAQANMDDKQYYDAGLSFMSVWAYFPQSDYAGPSLVEAAVVHNKIGQRDTAKKLYERASFVIDVQEDPRYAARLEKLADDLDHQ